MFYDSVKDVYEKLKDIDIEVYNPDWRYKCRACGAELRYMYCEARIYAIVCPKCKTVSLIAGRNPKEAFEMVGVKNVKNEY